MTSRIAAMLVPRIGFAHRGASAHAPENTIEAFLLAREMGATGIETDVWRTVDGQTVLVHDGAVSRLRGLRAHWMLGRRVASLERERLPAHIPTLGEYYEQCGADLPLSVDIKDADAFESVVADARKQGASQRLWLCHGDVELLARWRSRAADVKLVHSTAANRLPHGPERHAADLARAGINAVNMRRDAWSGGLTTLYHRFGVLAFGWDAQHSRHIAELIDAGIDAVYSDHVDRMVEVLSRFASGRGSEPDPPAGRSGPPA